MTVDPRKADWDVVPPASAFGLVAAIVVVGMFLAVIGFVLTSGGLFIGLTKP